MNGRRYQRCEERKFRRINVRYGSTEPTHRAVAMQISSRGVFLSTNDKVYERGSPVVVEIKGPTETWVVSGVVRHGVKVHRDLARFAKPGMGVELLDAPPACREYLKSL